LWKTRPPIRGCDASLRYSFPVRAIDVFDDGDFAQARMRVGNGEERAVNASRPSLGEVVLVSCALAAMGDAGSSLDGLVIGRGGVC
jgi:hypothetical protein